MDTQVNLPARLEAVERKHIERVLRACHGNIKHSAAALNMTPETLRYRVNKVHHDLGELARELRSARGNRGGRGRPRNARKGSRSKSALKRAYKEHGTIAATAKALELPTSSTRDLLREYGILK